MKSTNISPLIEKYSEIFEKDSKSKVFAPLAEGYRQAGLIDRAMEILKIGIRHNPTYIQGYISLGNCYFDLGEFNLSYTTLRPLVSDNRDNIRLQKLFGSACLELGHKEEALESYKYLLFLNPKDESVSKIVSELESDGQVVEEAIVPIETEKFEINDIEVKPEVVKTSLDEWIKVDLEKTTQPVEKKEESSPWKMDNVVSLSEKPSQNKEPEVNKEAPVITHSLVDLYINQGHLSKAKELLNKILELNPEEKSSLLKLEEVNRLDSSVRLEVEGEEEGHQRLMDSLDKKLGQTSAPEETQVKGLQNFLDAIQKRSESRKNSQL